MESDSDEDLKRAIALSLAGDVELPAIDRGVKPLSGSATDKITFIDLVSDDTDDDDDDLVLEDSPYHNTLLDTNVRQDAAVAVKTYKSQAECNPVQETPNLYKQVQSGTGDYSTPHISLHRTTTPFDEPSMSSLPLSTLNGLNRKQMEAERLARLDQKRKRGDDTAFDLSGFPSAKILKAAQSSSHSRKVAQPSISPQTHGTSAIQFPSGVIKRTWALGYPRQQDDIKIEEVLQNQDLQLAVLSAFQVDVEWITSKLRPDTKVIWVLQAKTEAEVDRPIMCAGEHHIVA